MLTPRDAACVAAQVAQGVDESAYLASPGRRDIPAAFHMRILIVDDYVRRPLRWCCWARPFVSRDACASAPACTPRWVTRSRRYVGVALPGLLVLLHQLAQRLRDGGVIGGVLLSASAEAVPGGSVGDLDDFVLRIVVVGAAAQSAVAPLGSVGDDAPDVLTWPDGRAPEPLPGARLQNAALLSRGPGQPLGLLSRHSPPTTEAVPLGQKPLARIALHDEPLMLVPQLVP